MKDNDWNSNEFQEVDWQAFHSAYKTMSRSHRISIMKLTKGIWNTNTQNKKYYYESPLCPICKSQDKSWAHVFRCKNEVAETFRLQELKKLSSQLLQCIPKEVHSAITNTTDHQHSAGIVAAFQSQTRLGWQALLQGHISIKWAQAVADTSTGGSFETSNGNRKRGHVNLSSTGGHTARPFGLTGTQLFTVGLLPHMIVKKMQLLRDRARDIYRQYDSDPHCIPSSMNFLF